MVSSTLQAKLHLNALLRVFDLGGRKLTPALAESILALDFPDADAARIDELNARANDGQSTEEEAAELEALINVGNLLAYWQSKARQSLEQPE